MDRRAFFTGAAGVNAPIRPPYSMGEIAFHDACTQCSACVDACPTDILINDEQQRPVVDFSKGHCTFCQACSDICPTLALDLNNTPNQIPWTITASLDQNCVENSGVACRACEYECGEGAIRFKPQVGGRHLVTIDQDDCTGCGECIGVCPANAISIGNAPDSQNHSYTRAAPPNSDPTTKECAQ